MRPLIPLLLLALTACEPPFQAHSCEPSSNPEVPTGSTVQVLVPRDAESTGTHVPVLYLEQDRALFFPEGVSGARPAVVPSPTELLALGQRRDILIVTVTAEATVRRETRPEPRIPDGYTEYVTHVPL